MLPNHFHCPLSTGGRQITMPMHRYKPQAESPEAKCPRFALIRCRMRSRALRKLQTHTIAPKGHRKGQVRSHLIVDVLCHPKSALKARARANGNGVEVGGQGERSKPWGAGIVIRRHYFRLSPVCGSIAWAGLSQLPCPPNPCLGPPTPMKKASRRALSAFFLNRAWWPTTALSACRRCRPTCACM